MKSLHLIKAFCLLAVTVLAFSAFGCGQSQKQNASDEESASATSSEQSSPSDAEGEDSPPSQNTPSFTVESLEVANTPYGTLFASDGEHIYFYYGDGNSAYDARMAYGGADGFYCVDMNLNDPVRVFEEYRCDPVCLANGKMYCEGNRGIVSVDMQSHEINLATDVSGGGVRSMAPYENDGDSNGTQIIYASNDDRLFLAQPSDSEDGWTADLIGDLDEDVRYALPGDGVVYYTLSGDGYELWSYAMEDGAKTKIASITDEWAFTVVGSDVYYLPRLDADYSSGDGNTQLALELMKSDAQGNVESTGIMGDIGGRLYTYGDCVFYTQLFEEQGDDGETVLIGRPACYDTVSGEHVVIDRAAYEGMDIGLMGVSGGYLYFHGYTQDEVTGETRGSTYFDRLDGTGELVNVDELTANAQVSQQATDWKEAWDQQMEEEAAAAQAEAEAARAEEEAAEAAALAEEYADEPYGPGESTLYLSAPDDRSACYRLVRMDGSTEFQILLGPGETITQSFPCGRYTLKTAEGQEWISDEEAFGPEGDYDTTDVYTFEDGGAYEIGAGTSGDFYGDSQSGFTG